MARKSDDDAAALEGPVCHHTAPSGNTPLVWVGDGEEAAEAVLRRVAVQALGGDEVGPEPERAAGAFGARQRGWLTRLTWAPSPSVDLRLVRSRSFLDADALDAMAAAMPEGAIEVPPGADGVIDGLTPEGEVMFYALFQGPGSWTRVPLMPVPPPFDQVRAPLVLGDAEARVRSWAERLQERGLDETGRELIAAASAVFTADRR